MPEQYIEVEKLPVTRLRVGFNGRDSRSARTITKRLN
ncbi:hypothetical protein EYZ11_012247 [Aspergillus tanneri]|uniref:Uncharacterized protein n=1 Tax=Aspergillus tanneri TaxID=1220188 RepID=A0A4S3J0R8_9EURO|nr:hypothetical protein EYZ11_012247 [Aspergillus tanneri]